MIVMSDVAIKQSLTQAVGVYSKLIKVVRNGDDAVIDCYIEIKQEMATLAVIANTNALLCEVEKKSKEKVYEELLKEKETLCAKADEEKTTSNALTAEIAGLSSKISSYKKKINDCESEIRKLRNEIERLNKESTEKKKKAKRWCWVPVYGLVVYIDYSATTKVNQEKINSRVNEINGFDADLQKTSSELEARLSEQRAKSTQLSALDAEIILKVQKIDKAIEEVNKSTANWYDWQYLNSIYEKIASKIDATITAEKITMCFELIIALQGKTAQLIAKAKTEEFIAGCSYRGNMLFTGQKLSKGEYIASLNQHFVAVLNQKGEFTICSAQKQIWSAPKTGDTLEITSNGIKLNDWIKGAGANILIMQDDGNLAAYKNSPNREIVWTSDTSQYSTGEHKTFTIPFTKYNGIFKIKTATNSLYAGFNTTDDMENITLQAASEKTLSKNQITQLHSFHAIFGKIPFFEGHFHNANANANTNTNDNQKFEFKYQSGGYHIISAVHSRKVLEAQETDDTIIQNKFDPRKNNQQWYIINTDKDVVYIFSEHSGKCLSVAKNFSPNEKLLRCPPSGNNTQLFSLIPEK